MTRPLCLLLACCLALLSPRTRADDDLGLTAPAGFNVTLYADDNLAHNIYSMTIDSHGRVVVAGPGYVKTLHDDDGDGRADRATLYSERPTSGAQGLYFDGDDLVCTGDNAVLRFRDADGDGAADGPPKTWTSLRNPEHGAHGIVQGPDGWFYLICGNDAGLSEAQVTTATSPVKQPRCGGVVRFSPDGRQSEVFAHGFRNPYDIDFNAAGHLFTVDADGERDYHLPWYAPTRLFDVAQGMEHGWLLQGWTRSWTRPQSFFDNVERAAEIGRGSPTGLVVYRHRQFPERYRGGVFSACWTLGRIYLLPLEPIDATYRSQAETFLQTTGNVGFAPCDLAVGPDGDLFVAIGGRKMRGGVFRVRYTAGSPPEPVAGDRLQQVLAADQPLASWLRARWVPAVRELGRQAFKDAASDPRLDSSLRVRAVEILTELFDGISDDVARRAIQPGDAQVNARIAWSLGRKPSPESQRLLTELTRLPDSDPLLTRAAWEALADGPLIDEARKHTPGWGKALDSPHRRVRSAAIRTAQKAGQKNYQYRMRELRLDSTAQLLADLRIDLGLNRFAGSPELVSRFLDFQAEPALRLEVLRLLQLYLGDVAVQPSEVEVFSGYVAAGQETEENCRAVMKHVSAIFPTHDAELNRELARLAGMLAVEERTLLEKLANQWTPDSSTTDDIHYLIVAALVPGVRPTSVTQKTAAALANLHQKMADRQEHPSQNWPLRVGEMFEQLCQRDPNLAGVLVSHEKFGRPEHALFAAKLTGDDRLGAIRKLLAVASASDAPATSELVKLLGELPADESWPYLRRQWDEIALHDAIVPILARQPADEDRDKFVEALTSVQPPVVEQAALALAQLKAAATAGEIAGALQALRQACTDPKQTLVRQRLARLLAHWTIDASNVPIGVDETKSANLASTYAPWFEWFARNHPREAAVLGGPAGEDAAAWRERLATIDWSSGRAAEGKTAFERRSCHLCHLVGGHLGPELSGAVARMSRDDLLTAIIDPNKEVSPTYETTLIATRSGQVYHGLIVYESPEGTLLQTAPDSTVRIAGDELASMRKSRQSLMPSGLLNASTDQELADLMAYLKTLTNK